MIASLALAAVLAGCGGSGVAKTVSSAARSAASSKASADSKKGPAGSGSAGTVSAPAQTRPLAVSYKAALAGLEMQCAQLPATASVPAVRGKAQARTLALIVLPRAYPLTQMLDRVSRTYVGSTRFLAAVRGLRRLSAIVLQELRAALAEKQAQTATALDRAVRNLGVRAARMSARECSV